MSIRKYKKPAWAVQQIRRISGLIEDICDHQVGHPNREWLHAHPKLSHLGIHGCDGCCDPDSDSANIINNEEDSNEKTTSDNSPDQ